MAILIKKTYQLRRSGHINYLRVVVIVMAVHHMLMMMSRCIVWIVGDGGLPVRLSTTRLFATVVIGIAYRLSIIGHLELVLFLRRRWQLKTRLLHGTGRSRSNKVYLNFRRILKIQKEFFE